MAQAIVVAVGVVADGRREVLGFDVSDSEGFRSSFLLSSKTWGPDGAKKVIETVFRASLISTAGPFGPTGQC